MCGSSFRAFEATAFTISLSPKSLHDPLTVKRNVIYGSLIPMFFLRVRYYDFTIKEPKNPILAIKAPRVQTASC